MREYGKVHSSFWSSPSIRGLSDDGKMLALYLLTSPHSNIIGAFRLPDGYACEDLEWSSERVAKGFAELLSNGFANRCETTKWVWVVKHLDWNPPENPNQRKSAAKIAGTIPDQCAWKPVFIEVCGDLIGLEPTPKPNPCETVSEPLLNQKQKQEQKQEQKGSVPEPSPLAPSPAGAVCKALRAIGFTATNPSDPRLIALLDAGATTAEIIAVGEEAVRGGKGWAWVLTVVQARRNDAAAIALAPAVKEAKPWDNAA